MKMLLVAIFALSCAQISNASWTTTRATESTTLYYPLPETTTHSPICNPENGYCPIKELETCGFKYGAPAAKNQFPHVAFLKSRNTHRVQYCSGSLIHVRWVLTSAYCTLPDAKVDVTLGALVPFDIEDPDVVVVQSEAVFVHPGYLPFYRDPKNDVALIKLSRPVKSAAIIPINLKRDSGPLSKDKVTFAGWGEVGYETLTFTKNLTIFEGPCQCKNTDELAVRYESVSVDSKFFCCISGDYFCFIHNGGGLVVDGVLVAVLSTRCFSHCRHHEGIFTNIYNHLQWIDETLSADCVPDPKVYRACSDIAGIIPGIHLIQPNNYAAPFQVFCDLRLDGEKWTVIQQRFSKAVDFYRNYANYTMGFGPIDGNHWLGLEKIHQITKDGDHELLVELKAHNSTSGYAHYSTFKVDSEETGFKLTISGYSGTAGDSMYKPIGIGFELNGMKFSTFDNDQDKWSWGNCAERWEGAWWYNLCSYSHLNGPYHDTPEDDFKSLTWYQNFDWYSLKTARMMVRRK